MGSRDASWVDYGNLGANIVQVALLVAANRRVSQMATIQTQIATVQAQQAERARLETELRQFIFELEEGIDRLSCCMSMAPLGVLTTIYFIERVLNDGGIQPVAFDQFGDKDRIKALRKRLAELRESSGKSLTQGEVEEAKRIMRLASGREDLNKLITALDAQERLKETEGPWRKLEKKKKEMVAGWGLLLVLSFLVGIASMCGFFIALSIASSSNNSSLAVVILPLYAGSLSLVGFVIGVVKTTSSPKGYAEMNLMRTSLRSKFLPQQVYDNIYAFFGKDLGIEAYQRIEDEIANFFSRALENDKDGKALPASLLHVALPPRLFKAVKQ